MIGLGNHSGPALTRVPFQAAVATLKVSQPAHKRR